MKLRLALALIATIGAALAIGGSGCGGSDTHGGLGGGGSDSSGSHHPSGTNSGGGSFAGPSTGPGSGCKTHCSSDLHSVVDCHGNVVKTCPMDMGCGASGCVAPCQSADENKSSIGCDYYSVEPDSISDVAGACYAAYIANTWDTPVAINVERGGMPLDITNSVFTPSGSGQSITYTPLTGGMLPVGEVAIVFLSRAPGGGSSSIGCPAGITPATSIDPAVHGTGYGSAFHITTTAPVVAYDIFPYGGGPAAATSATLLLPTSAWDTNYIGVDAFDDMGTFQPSMDIVAKEDATNVKISPSAAIQGGSGVAPTGAGQPITYVVNKGQILQFTQTAELVGSVIQSDKPIAVWGGETCLVVPATQVACDSAHQQIPPIRALGSEYVAVKFRDRYQGVAENPPWRLVGAVDGTTLTWDPAPPPGAPTTLGLGQVAMFNSPGPFVVKSQDQDHPFYVSAYMEGCGQYVQNPNYYDCRGDPEFVNVIPPDQYLSDYVFFTDPSYPETNLVLVRKKNGAAFEDVSLDCLGNVTTWQNLDTAGNYQYALVDLVTGDFQGVNGCDNGRHKITSKAPFGLTVWGWGSGATCPGGDPSNCFFGTPEYTQAVSYAYPAGASVQPINTVVVPPAPK